MEIESFMAVRTRCAIREIRQISFDEDIEHFFAMFVVGGVPSRSSASAEWHENQWHKANRII